MRTLQRQLTSEGTNFGTVLDDVRREKAEHWLTATDLPMSELAAMLDFASQATFSRCGKRWWGCPPLSDVPRVPGQSVA